jgi:thioredoxin 1
MLELTDQNFEKEVSMSQKLVLVDFWADWCAPCQLISPLIEKIFKQYSGKIKIGKCNVDQASDTALMFKIEAIPTLIIFKNGQLVARIVGLVDYETLESKIKSCL